MADLMTTSQVQDLLRVDRTTIYRMVEDGRLPAVRVGKQWRFVRDEIERWLHAQASPAAQTAPAPVTVPHGAALKPAATKPSDTARLAEILPLPCIQLIQDAFAEMLGVMLVVTDMRGQAVTEISNPCEFFLVATQNAGGIAACRGTWQELAGGPSMEPRFVTSEVGLLCTRGLMRLGSELVGTVILGGIAPENWPPSAEQLAAMANLLAVEPAALSTKVDAVYRIDPVQRERALRFVQRIADVFSHIAEDRTGMVGRLQAIAALTSL